MNRGFNEIGCLKLVVLFLALLPAISPVTVSAESIKVTPPKTALPSSSLFTEKFSSKSFFDGRFDGKVVEVNDESPKPEAAVAPAAKDGPVFVTSDPKSHILPPDQDPRVRINPEAPGPFIAMATAYQDGDRETAAKYADQFVRYQMNLMFEVRDMTQLIGEALVRQKVIDEEDWVGVGQYLDFEFASAREENSSILKPTHEEAMKRIKPDPKNEAEIYYFFTLNCSYCRKMAADVERLWRVTKGDKKLKMVALTMGPQPKEWIESYRKYTGMTLPILEGEKVAKSFGVRFVPGVVVVSPNTNTAYFKTGEQDFARLYDFVRHVQGLPSTLTPEVDKLAKTPIGEAEVAKVSGVNTELWENGAGRSQLGQTLPVSDSSGKKRDYSAERF